MGTTVSLLLPEEDVEVGGEQVRCLFTHWEQVFSRFLPESELSRLNRQPGVAVPVSDLFYEVLASALNAARASGGVYDPALLAQLLRQGYDRSFERLPLERFDPVIPGEPGGRWQGIKVNPIQRSVTLPEGVQLDFGGIAKGMAVDAALTLLAADGVRAALVNAGGDLAVLGLPPGEEAWPISVPGRERFWAIPLRSGALATSGQDRRFWLQDGQRRHHLLDPRTGEPAQSGLWSVTVVADRCEQAEVAAKVVFILGAHEGAAFLRQHGIGGLLIHTDGMWETVEPWHALLMEEL